MNSISQIRAKGRNLLDEPVEWTVATYLDPQEAYKHHTLCHDYLAKARAMLEGVSERDKDYAMSMLQPAHDPQYAEKKALYVTYSLDSYPLTASPAPEMPATTWRALDISDQQFKYLVDGVAHSFLRDEIQEGAPEGALPMQKFAEKELWAIGVDPSLPAIGFMKGETGGDVYYGHFEDAVEERRRELRLRRQQYRDAQSN